MQVSNHGLFYIVRNFILSSMMSSTNRVLFFYPLLFSINRILFNNGPKAYELQCQQTRAHSLEGLIHRGSGIRCSLRLHSSFMRGCCVHLCPNSFTSIVSLGNQRFESGDPYSVIWSGICVLGLKLALRTRMAQALRIWEWVVSCSPLRPGLHLTKKPKSCDSVGSDKGPALTESQGQFYITRFWFCIVLGYQEKPTTGQ